MEILSKYTLYVYLYTLYIKYTQTYIKQTKTFILYVINHIWQH